MLLLISGALSSCGKGDIDYRYYFEHIYVNETNHDICVHGYSYDDFFDNHDWLIAPDDSIVINNLKEYGNAVPVPAECDSVSVVFDDEKKLMVKHGDWILRNDNKERVSRYFVRLRHYITEEMYDSASWLVPSD